MRAFFKFRPIFKRIREGEVMEGMIQYANEPEEIINFGRDFSGQAVEFVKQRKKLLIIDLGLVAFRFEWQKEGKKIDGLYCERYITQPLNGGIASAFNQPFRESAEVDSLTKAKVDELMSQVAK